jgi:hypothetical protein
MDEFANGYQQEDYNADMTEGERRVKIKEVVQAVAQSSGNHMLKITMVAEGARFDFHYNLVKNEYFNANATKFFDCFKIPRGNFEYDRWVGRSGRAYIAKGKPRDNGKSYWEIQYLIVPESPRQSAPAPAARPAPQPARQPVRQPVKQAAPASDMDDFTDDIPF